MVWPTLGSGLDSKGKRMIPAHSPEDLSRVREEEEGAQLKRNIVQFKLDRIDQKISSKTTLLMFFPVVLCREKSFQEAAKNSSWWHILL